MVSEESSFDDPVGKPGTDFSFPTKSPGGRGSRISRYFKGELNRFLDALASLDLKL